MTDRIFYHFRPLFALFALKTQKLKILKKMKKTPKTSGDIIILHMCTKNHNHMVNCSWDMARDGCNCYFFILGYFLPFYIPNSPEKNSQKWKKTPGDTIILHKCTKNYGHMVSCSWHMACEECNYFLFWAIF